MISWCNGELGVSKWFWLIILFSDVGCICIVSGVLVEVFRLWLDVIGMLGMLNRLLDMVLGILCLFDDVNVC